MIYLDNAATSFPKPSDCFQRALQRYLHIGASPGRGGYDLAVESGRAVDAVRGKLLNFFGADETDYQLYFSHNATDALNSALLGLLAPGDHVISSRLEHNSVLRPLHHLQHQKGIDVDLVPFSSAGFIEPESIQAAIRPNTRLVIVTHASNVLGTVQPVDQIAAICGKREIPVILDVSQSAGVIPIQVKRWGIQGLAFTGHKSLLGPTGTGGLLLHKELRPKPTRFGGTGVDSYSLFHTLDYPHRLEAGTINLLGILTLNECLDFIQESTNDIKTREMTLLEKLRDGLQSITGLQLFCADDIANHLPVLTCKLANRAAVDVGAILDGDFGIAIRAGLHCAPLVHEDLGTAPDGTIRFSPGPFNTLEDIDKAVEAMAEIASIS